MPYHPRPNHTRFHCVPSYMNIAPSISFLFLADNGPLSLHLASRRKAGQGSKTYTGKIHKRTRARARCTCPPSFPCSCPRRRGSSYFPWPNLCVLPVASLPSCAVSSLWMVTYGPFSPVRAPNAPLSKRRGCAPRTQVFSGVHSHPSPAAIQFFGGRWLARRSHLAEGSRSFGIKKVSLRIYTNRIDI